MTTLKSLTKNSIYIILLIQALAAVWVLILFDGTGGGGDSIHHFLFAKHAPDHPELFFDHWAKPLFVLLSSPFAQFGVNGIKVFNAVVAILTTFFTYKVCLKLNLRNASLGAIMVVCSPSFFILTFSGLTEPLFALFLMISISLILDKKYLAGCILLSFLPFIRSEGLIIIGAYILYLLYIKKWKLLPLLLTGHFIYSVTGYFAHDDLLWVFTKVPYAKLSSTYGNGKLFDFIDKLYYVIGVPIYILFWLGILKTIWSSIKRQISSELFILVTFSFLAFFIAHSLFWYLGIFNSMGLKRVLVAVIPLIGIIALIGFNFITEDLLATKKTIKLVLQALLTIYVVIFPFTSNPAAINWERDLSLSVDQHTAQKVADFVIGNENGDHRFLYTHPYLSKVLQVDHFDPSKRIDLSTTMLGQLKKGDIIIWENWFSVVEKGISRESLDNNPELKHLYSISNTDRKREIQYSVYRKE